MRAFVEQLDAEFIKSLQNIDPHTHEYVERLRDEGSILELAAMVHQHYENLGDKKQAAKVAMKRVEHIYYKVHINIFFLSLSLSLSLSPT